MGAFDEDVDGGVADFGVSSAHDAGQAEQLLSAVCAHTGDEHIFGVNAPFGVVERRELVTLSAASHNDLVTHESEVVGVQRLPEFEHDVVGDVHDERNGAHAGFQQSLRHPERRLCGRVDAANAQRGEAGAAVVAVDGSVVGQFDRVPLTGNHRGDCVGGVCVVLLFQESVFTADAAHRHLISAVGRDVDVEDFVVQAQQFRGVLAGGEIGKAPVGEHDDAVVVFAQAQFASRADHAVGDVAVGFACRNSEVTGQNSTGKRCDDVVANTEVVRSAHNALRFIGADVNGAPVDGLAVGVLFRFAGENSADYERTCDGRADVVFFFQADAGEFGSEFVSVEVLRQVDVLGQPFQGYEHQFITPKAFEKRISPSTMSCMSLIPSPSMSVRSMPMPKAKPW